MAVVSKGGDPRRSGFSSRASRWGEEARSEGAVLRRRLASAVLDSQEQIVRSRRLRYEATGASRVAIGRRVRAGGARSRRPAVRVDQIHGYAHQPDPLAVTIALARACDSLGRVELFDAGRRSELPKLQLVALACPRDMRGSGQDPLNGHRSSEPRGSGSRRQEAASLHVYASSQGDNHIVRLVGELDLLEADRVRDLIVELAGSTVVLDLTDLRFVDAAGVAAVLAAHRRIDAAGHELRVRGARGIVRRVFEVTELGYLLRD